MMALNRANDIYQFWEEYNWGKEKGKAKPETMKKRRERSGEQ